MHLFRRPQVLFILSFCLCFGTARSLWAAEGVSSAWYQDPVTVEAYVRLPPEEEVHTLEALWLAGLGTSPDGPPGTLGLVWSQRGGLLPVWALQLQSDLGLLPADVRAETGTGVLRGSAVFPLPGVGKPRWGHVYHTVLSYDPATGALSLWVHDATAGETVISAEYTVGTLGGALLRRRGQPPRRDLRGGGHDHRRSRIRSPRDDVAHRRVEWRERRSGCTLADRSRLERPGGDLY